MRNHLNSAIVNSLATGSFYFEPTVNAKIAE